MKYFRSLHEETFFRLILILSLLFYFSITILIESIPYHPANRPILSRKPRKVKLVQSVPRIPIPPIKKKKIKKEVKKEIKKKIKKARPPVKKAKKVRVKPRMKEKVKRLKTKEGIRNIGLAGILRKDKTSLQKIIKDKSLNKTLEMNTISIPIGKRKSNKKRLSKRNVKKDIDFDIPMLVDKKFSGSFKHSINISGLKISRAKDLDDEGGPARTQASIQKVVKSRRGVIDFLYRKSLRINPTLRGKVVIEFIISEDGRVIKARIISSTLHNPDFEHQILRRIHLWKFPPLPGSGNTVVVYPMIFTPV